MLVGGVVDDELGHHLKPVLVRGTEERPEILERAVARMDAFVMCDVVAVVTKRRRVEGEQPDARDAKALDVVDLFCKPAEVADAIAIAVEEGADVNLIN